MTTFKLTKEEKGIREDILTRLQQAQDVLEESITDFNDELEMAKERVLSRVEAYNIVLGEAKEFAEGITGRIDEDVEEMSDHWKEGEKAQAVEEMKNSWEGLELDELELELPEPVDFSLSHAEDFENAPLEPEA